MVVIWINGMRFRTMKFDPLLLTALLLTLCSALLLGIKGGPSGDLFLHVRLEKHPDYRVIGSDLSYARALPPWGAVLGTEVPVHTLSGQVRIKIPSYTKLDTELRVKERGLPGGHLYVVIKIADLETTTDEKTSLRTLRYIVKLLASLEIKERAKRANSQQSIDRFLRDSANLIFYKFLLAEQSSICKIIATKE